MNAIIIVEPLLAITLRRDYNILHGSYIEPD